VLNKLVGRVNYGCHFTSRNPTYLTTTSKGTKYNKKWWCHQEEAILKLYVGQKLGTDLVSIPNARINNLNLQEIH